MNRKLHVHDWLNGWVPKEPLHQNEVETKAKTTGGHSKKRAFAVYYVLNFSIVISVLLLADYLGFSLVYKYLAGAAAAGLAGILGKFVLKLPWRNKPREAPQE
jgi:hypothetical protein